MVKKSTVTELSQLQQKVVAKDLNFFYGQKQALFNINIVIPERKVTAFIGPSGCGKSTFLRTINRMNDLIDNTKVEGGMFLDGENVYARETDVVLLRKRVGMVFQKPNPFPKSIYDNIAYGPRIHGTKNKNELDEIVEKSLRRSGLWDEVKDRLSESAIALSGGQQQRLCIARTLAIDPEVVLMDEPTSALDPKATQRVEDLIDELSLDYTIIIVTHNMQQAARVSDFTAFFFEGYLIEHGITERMFTIPNNKKTEEYITGRFS